MASHTLIIARIKQAREDKGWSQAELSRQMEQASNTIQKIESGFIKNPEKYLPQIAEVTGQSLSYFYGEDNPELTQFAEKARKYDALIELIKESGILSSGSNNSVNSNSGERNVTVGGNGNSLNVHPNADKIIQEVLNKNKEENELIFKILQLEHEEREKLLELYQVVKDKKPNK
jgi:transcriptional regulator with XRE-family HTH domain